MLRFLFALAVLVSITARVSAADVAADTATKKEKSQSEQLPKSVDLRPQMEEWGLTPRHQGRRNTCSVFTTAGVLEFAASKHNQKGTRFSVEYLNWACNQVINNHTQDRGQFFGDLLKAFEEHGICTQDEMPYTKKFDPSLEPTKEAIASAEKIRDLDLKVHWLRRWRSTPGLFEWNLRDVKTILAKGYPVASGASHSRILVGYEDDPNQPGGGIFYTQDSGKGKFSTVTYEFAKKNMNDLFWVEAP